MSVHMNQSATEAAERGTNELCSRLHVKFTVENYLPRQVNLMSVAITPKAGLRARVLGQVFSLLEE